MTEMRRVMAACLVALAAAAWPCAALAHEAAGGFILLMPTEIYILGASLAVLASFLILAVVPAGRFHSLYKREADQIVDVRPGNGQVIVSCLSFLFTLFLLYAGLAGKDDPLTNPITLGVWTLGWIVMSAVAAIFGNLWPWLNPWTGILTVLGLGQKPVLKLPAQLGHGIAIAQMFYLIWVDLISIHATDPEALFVHLIWFLGLNGFGMVLFGMTDWTRRAEPLHVLYHALSVVSPFLHSSDGWRLVLPGAAALMRPVLSLSAAGFIILMLAAGTFDGVVSTFKWLGFLGVNPLDFHGRSTVIGPNTLGLIVGVCLLATVFSFALWLGERIARTDVPLRTLIGRFAYTLLPIYVAYMLSHFATRLIMDAQYLWVAISDPLGRGWDLFGTADSHVTQSMFNTEAGVHTLWAFQTIVITLGHIVAVLMAHGIALETHETPRKAVLSQIPLAFFMVFYTSLGLWLLASPRI